MGASGPCFHCCLRSWLCPCGEFPPASCLQHPAANREAPDCPFMSHDSWGYITFSKELSSCASGPVASLRQETDLPVSPTQPTTYDQGLRAQRLLQSLTSSPLDGGWRFSQKSKVLFFSYRSLELFFYCCCNNLQKHSSSEQHTHSPTVLKGGV